MPRQPKTARTRGLERNPETRGFEGLPISRFSSPWRNAGRRTRLSERLRRAWDRPIRSLSNRELLLFLRFGIAPEPLLAEAKERVADCFDDGTELYTGELAEFLQFAKNRSL